MRVGLFMTCVTDTLFPQTGVAMVEVLERVGCSVDFPLEQTCCGQIHVNAGYADQAAPLLRRFVRTFPADRYDAIVAPSASCASTVKHGYARLAQSLGDPGLSAAVDDLAPKVFELSVFLVEQLGREDVGAYFPHTVAYHPTCHSLRHLRVGDAPQRLLSAVRGINLVELPDAETCCGFGGTFAVKNADVSTAMLSDKLAALRSSSASVCTAVDNSCLMHIAGGLTRTRAGIRALHLAEILASTEDSPA